jgi:hypothetical protein
MRGSTLGEASRIARHLDGTAGVFPRSLDQNSSERHDQE